MRSPYENIFDPLLWEYFESRGKLSSEKMEQLARTARLPSTPTLGYLGSRDEDGRYIIIVDPEIALLIREAFILAARGDLSVREIAEYLTAKGLRSRRGNMLTGSSLWVIFQNPFYCGKIRFHFSVFQGTHEPIVSEELFEKVQKQLDRFSRYPECRTNTWKLREEGV